MQNRVEPLLFGIWGIVGLAALLLTVLSVIDGDWFSLIAFLLGIGVYIWAIIRRNQK